MSECFITIYIIVKSHYEEVIVVITRVWGRAEDECNNNDSLWVQGDITGFYPTVFDVQYHYSEKQKTALKTTLKLPACKSSTTKMADNASKKFENMCSINCRKTYAIHWNPSGVIYTQNILHILCTSEKSLLQLFPYIHWCIT